MKFYPPIKTVIFSIAIVAWAVIPFSTSFFNESNAAGSRTLQCPSGHAAARLTGWTLNNQTPSGSADYNEATRTLTVNVESVALPDGRVLAVFAGEDRIGALQPLKDGKATGTIAKALPEGARVRVFDEERPIVSANLQCAPAATATPTILPTISPVMTPSPTPSPDGTATPTPTPSPSPTVSPSPGGEPTPDPMPKQSPAPSPSPGV